MKKLFWVFLCVSIMAVGFIIAPNRAVAISYDLNTVIEWETGNITNTTVSGEFSDHTTFGTLSFVENEENGNNVDIVVDLIGDGVHKIMSIYFNFNDDSFDGSEDFDTIDYIGIEEGKNTLQADGYTAGYFDLSIPDPPPGQLGNEPFSTTITLSGYNLDPGDFDYTDSSGVYSVAVHVGTFGTEPGEGGEDSIWVGSTVSIPDPAAVFLLGSACLIGFSGARRKFKKY